MNRIFLIVGLSAGILMGGTVSWADSPTPQTTVAVKKAHKALKSHKVKKSHRVEKKAAAKEVWVCPMGDYSGPKTKDGKCPKCGMNLVKVDKKAADSDSKK